jgi:hypothetical protein
MPYVKLVGAELYGETVGARQFVFGGTIRQVGKEQSKIENGLLYIERWVARRNMVDWNGEFVPGTRFTEMKSAGQSEQEQPETNAIDEVISLLEQVITKLRAMRET